MFDSWSSSEDWWETVPPQKACTRFRVFFPDDHQTVPRDIVDVMAALGAWREPSLRTVAERATFATGWPSTRTHSRRTISSLARSVPSPKRWTPRSSRKVAATRYSPRPGTGTKSTSSTSRVPALTGNSAHPKEAASICVGWITRLSRGAFPAQMVDSPLIYNGINLRIHHLTAAGSV